MENVIQVLIEECEDLADDEPAWVDGWLPVERLSERMIEPLTKREPRSPAAPMNQLEIWRSLRDIDIPKTPAPINCAHAKKRRHCNNCDDIVCVHCGKSFPRRSRNASQK